LEALLKLSSPARDVLKSYLIKQFIKEMIRV